jgi:hypothetical protein
MKPFLSAVLLSLSAFAFAADAPQPADPPPVAQGQCAAIDQSQLATLTEEAQRALLERRGCCSHHGGVCGCGGTRAQCCDGSLSPSCGC